MKIKYFSIQDLYTIDKFKIKHRKDPVTKWIKLPCVYKIKIGNHVVHVGRSDTCKKHGGAEKVRKALLKKTFPLPRWVKLISWIIIVILILSSCIIIIIWGLSFDIINTYKMYSLNC